MGTRTRRHLASGLVAVVGAVAAVVRFIVGIRRLLQGLTVVGLAFYGTWLLFRPAAYLVAGALLLLDLVTDRS